ncbi:MAG: WD40 repeat domain-containing protein [Okeania sp. SIO3B5]|uniref:WD40 repeat domain-containing protein n=1 Tax=Okeania sp. SIO3B5 TaxID=2607811 RepID=UPI0013FFC3AB|nr:WD40 repeat domain-containing protein [Okeania sp. SIO3B5]NEO52125.1 WD40 repeat domain-containing protein [Okeania sp. SIO3B5]
MIDVHAILDDFSSNDEEMELFLGESLRWAVYGDEVEVEDLCQLLSDYYFIEAKINHNSFGIQALIKDYDLIDDIDFKLFKYGYQSIKSLKLIQGALRLSAHILNQDSKQLTGQLSGRLLDFDAPEIQNLLQQIPQTQVPCLRSLRASLSSPTGHLISTLGGHFDGVNAVAVTPDGKFVVSGSSDHTVKVWNLNTATEILTFKGHTSPVNAVAVTPDGKKVVSGASDNTVRVWNLETGAEMLTFNGHSLPIVAVAVTVDGKKVVSASIANINSIKVWNIETEREELTLEGHNDLVRTIAITRYEVISGGDDGIIKVWSLKNGKLLFKSGLHRNENGDLWAIYAIAATVDCSRIVAVCSDNSLIGLDAKTNRQTYQRKPFRRAFYRKLKSHTAPIVDIALTSDGTRFISASLDKTLKVWDAKSGKQLLNLIGHNDSIHCVITSPDDKKLISASQDKALKVWNLDSVEKCIQATNDISVNDITITPDGEQVFFCLKNNTVIGYDLENIKPIYKFITDKNWSILQRIKNIFIFTIELLFLRSCLVVLSWITVFFSTILTLYLFLFPMGLIFELIFKSYYTLLTFICISILQGLFFKKPNTPNTKIKSKNLTDYTKFSDIKSYTQLNLIWCLESSLTWLSKLSKKKKQIIAVIATQSNQGLIFIDTNIINLRWSSYFVTVWSLRDKKHIFDLRSHLQFLYLVVFCILILIISVLFFLLSKDNFFFVLGIGIGICAVYIRLIGIVLFFNESLTTILITPNEKYLISGSTNSTIKVWNMEKKKFLFALKGHKQKVTALTITPDSKYLISGSKDKTIKVWNLKTKKQLLTFKGHGSSINTMSVTPDGNHLISGSKDKTIKIWNLKKEEEIRTFTGHTDSVNSVKVTSDGELVISASSDKTIQVWEFKTRKVIATFTGESEINCCAVAPDNVTIVAGDISGQVHYLRLEGIEMYLKDKRVAFKG